MVNASLVVWVYKHLGDVVCHKLILAGLFQYANRGQVPQDSALANRQHEIGR